MKEVEREQKKEDFSWWRSLRSLTGRRLVAVLGITVMVREANTNKSFFLHTMVVFTFTFYEIKQVHLCGISVVTAYLVDIFSASSISPLALLLVSSLSGNYIL